MATKAENCVEFCRCVILGPTGMDAFERHEWVIWHEDIRVHAAEWTMRCLANPDCAGSGAAVVAILERRAEQGDARAAAMLAAGANDTPEE